VAGAGERDAAALQVPGLALLVQKCLTGTNVRILTPETLKLCLARLSADLAAAGRGGGGGSERAGSAVSAVVEGASSRGCARESRGTATSRTPPRGPQVSLIYSIRHHTSAYVKEAACQSHAAQHRHDAHTHTHTHKNAHVVLV
jgi:hypothetical protein